LGGQFVEILLNSEKLVFEPGNAGLAIEERVWRAHPEP
jgi:hypothetical protein